MRILLLLALIVFASRLAVASCEFTKEDDLDVINIGGGKVYMMFDRHPANRLGSFHEEMAQAFNPELTAAERRALLIALINKPENLALLRDQQKEYDTILKLLKTRKVNWIGHEETAEDQADMRWQLEQYAGLKSDLTGPNIGLSQADTEKILLQYVGARMAIWNREPGYSNLATRVALDEKSLRDRALSTAEVMLPCAQRLEKLPRSSLTDEVLATGNHTFRSHEMVPQSNIDAVIRRLPIGLQGPSKCFLETSNQFADIEIQRNNFAADAIMKQINSGLVIYGGFHEKDIKDRLQKACLAQGKTSGGATGGPPSRPVIDKK